MDSKLNCGRSNPNEGIGYFVDGNENPVSYDLGWTILGLKNDSWSGLIYFGRLINYHCIFVNK
jgi:hypothetical protein